MNKAPSLESFPNIIEGDFSESAEKTIEQNLEDLKSWIGMESQEFAEISAEDLEERVLERAEEDVNECRMTTTSLAQELFGKHDSRYDLADIFLDASKIIDGTITDEEVLSFITKEPEVIKNRFKREIRALVSGEEVLDGVELSEELVDKLNKRRERIVSFVESCKNSPERVYQAIFDESPENEVELVTTPYTVELYTSNRDDYDKAYGGSEPEEAQSGAFHRGYSRVPGLEDGGIIVVDLTAIDAWKKGSTKKDIVAHERQHAFRKFVDGELKGEALRVLSRASNEDLTEMLKELPENERATVAVDLFKTVRDVHFELTVKDELLAYYRDGRQPRLIEHTLSESPLYNKFPQAKNEAIENMTAVGITELEANFIYGMVFETGYKVKLHKLVELLEDARRTGLTRHEIATLMTTKRLEEWPDVVKQEQEKV